MYVKVKNLKFKRSFGWLDYTGNLTYLPLEGWECTHVTIPFGRRCCPYGLQITGKVGITRDIAQACFCLICSDSKIKSRPD